MIDFEPKELYGIEDLQKIVSLLRSKDGCPWDQRQTHESIRRNLIEEAYEAAEAILEHDPEHLAEELGDVLLQVVFHAEIGTEDARFSFRSICDNVCRKLIRRHPHVFSSAHAESAEDVLELWEAAKRGETGYNTVAEEMKHVGRNLPALWRAEKIQKKASKVGFDWPDCSGAFQKISEELGELLQAEKEGTNTAEELGDLLFAVVNAARFLKIDPEEALSGACDKFIFRFDGMEQAATRAGKGFEALTIGEMERLWNAQKHGN